MSDVLGEVGAWQQSLYTATVHHLTSTHLPGHLPVTWIGKRGNSAVAWRCSRCRNMVLNKLPEPQTFTFHFVVVVVVVVVVVGLEVER